MSCHKHCIQANLNSTMIYYNLIRLLTHCYCSHSASTHWFTAYSQSEWERERKRAIVCVCENRCMISFIHNIRAPVHPFFSIAFFYVIIVVVAASMPPQFNVQRSEITRALNHFYWGNFRELLSEISCCVIAFCHIFGFFVCRNTNQFDCFGWMKRKWKKKCV